MKTILKIVIAGIILLILAVGGCTALVGGAISEADKQIKKDQAEYGMSPAEFRKIKTGVAYDEFVKTHGKPDPEQTQRITVDGMKSVTVYYNVEGGDLLDMYQFSFTNGTLESKAKF